MEAAAVVFLAPRSVPRADRSFNATQMGVNERRSNPPRGPGGDLKRVPHCPDQVPSGRILKRHRRSMDDRVTRRTETAMVAKSSEIQRSERASNNTRADVATSGATPELAPLSAIDDVRARAFRGLHEASRPLLWRILLGVVECEDASNAPTEKRAQYHRWRREFQSFRVEPAHLEPEECKPSDKTTAPKEPPAYARDVALMREIDKDVARTRSEMPFFADGGIQQQWMLRILFVYAKLHPDLGYMQGMNEILAPIIYVLASDNCEDWASEAEPDAFYAFSEVMKSVKLLYNKSPSDPSKTGVDMQMARLAVLLRQHDALLWQHLNSIGLTPDFYSFRWYMTLLSREFSMEATLRIWDALLSDPKRFSFLHYVSLSLLRSQRTRLLAEGFSGCLKILQSPPVVDVEDLLASAQRMREQDRQTDKRRSSVTLVHFAQLSS